MMHLSISTDGRGLGDVVDLLKRLVGKLAISHMYSSQLKSEEGNFHNTGLHFQCIHTSVNNVHVHKILILHSDLQHLFTSNDQ